MVEAIAAEVEKVREAIRARIVAAGFRVTPLAEVVVLDVPAGRP